MKDFTMQAPVRKVELRMFGYRCSVTANNITNGNIQKAIDEAYSAIVQTSYIEYILADNVLILCKDYLVEKGYYKQKVKMLFNETQKDLRRAMNICETCINEDYYNEMSCFHYDNVKNDFDKLRKVIATKLANLGVPKAGLCAWLILCYNIIMSSKDSFERVYQRELKRHGVDLHNAYTSVEATLAYKRSRELMYYVMGDDADRFTNNIIGNKQVQMIWNRIFDTVFSKKNAIASRKEAYYSLSEEEQARWDLQEDGDLIKVHPFD